MIAATGEPAFTSDSSFTASAVVASDCFGSSAGVGSASVEVGAAAAVDVVSASDSARAPLSFSGSGSAIRLVDEAPVPNCTVVALTSPVMVIPPRVAVVEMGVCSVVVLVDVVGSAEVVEVAAAVERSVVVPVDVDG